MRIFAFCSWALVECCYILHYVERGPSIIKAKVKLNETALDKISSQFKTLNDSFEELKGELHDARCKVDEMGSSIHKHAKQIEGMRERLLSFERYSREYNLPESTDEDCVQKVRNILSKQLDMEPEIENAHRVGPRNEDKPRVIICKFLYHPQRYKVIQKKRDLEDGIWVTEDLIWEDCEAMKKLKEVMKEAFQNGKKPRLARGKLYIDGALYRKT